MRVLVWCNLKRAENELKTTRVSLICVYLLAKMLFFRNEHFLLDFKMKMACIKIRALHCYENPSYVFLFWELHGLSPNFHMHVSVSDLHISRIGPHIWLQQNRQTDLSWLYECRNWETEHYNSVLEIRRLHSFISGNT